jgi:SAM-dependent methyltransferase
LTDAGQHDAWSVGRSYDEYMGRWSRGIAEQFVAWLDPSSDLDWADVGCGTGALTATILRAGAARSVVGVDPSAGFVEHAAAATDDLRARFEVGTAAALPLGDTSVDVVASALAYNFVPDRAAALAEFRRVVRPGGTISFYVWDYPGGGVGFIDEFWKAAAQLDSAAGALDEADRFPFCTPDRLHAEAIRAGYDEVGVREFALNTDFPTFADFWHPFTLGAGPAPGYLATLDESARSSLRGLLRSRLGAGPIELVARAWAVRSSAPIA